jgi:hypothetical protein
MVEPMKISKPMSPKHNNIRQLTVPKVQGVVSIYDVFTKLLLSNE